MKTTTVYKKAKRFNKIPVPLNEYLRRLIFDLVQYATIYCRMKRKIPNTNQHGQTYNVKQKKTCLDKP